MLENCSRVGCENDEADVLLGDLGFICPGCQNEFKNYLNDKGLGFTEMEIRLHLENFMLKPRRVEIDIDNFFAKRNLK
jgi:hypothetical protein